MKRFMLVSLVLLLSACGTPELATPLPTPESIRVVYPLALEPWADGIAGCANGNPIVAVYYLQASNQNMNEIAANEIVLALGEPLDLPSNGYLSQVGRERIVVIVNQENETNRLSSSQLLSIYSGELSRWGEWNGKSIKVWVLPAMDPVRATFDQIVLSLTALTTHAMLAPHPAAMLEAVADEPEAIGYLPVSFLSSADTNLLTRVKTVQLDAGYSDKWEQPVIAITHGEPQGQMRELLVCLSQAR
jgi:hypothetical protein